MWMFHHWMMNHIRQSEHWMVRWWNLDIFDISWYYILSHDDISSSHQFHHQIVKSSDDIRVPWFWDKDVLTSFHNCSAGNLPPSIGSMELRQKCLICGQNQPKLDDFPFSVCLTKLICDCLWTVLDLEITSHCWWHIPYFSVLHMNNWFYMAL